MAGPLCPHELVKVVSVNDTVREYFTTVLSWPRGSAFYDVQPVQIAEFANNRLENRPLRCMGPVHKLNAQFTDATIILRWCKKSEDEVNADMGITALRTYCKRQNKPCVVIRLGIGRAHEDDTHCAYLAHFGALYFVDTAVRLACRRLYVYVADGFPDDLLRELLSDATRQLNAWHKPYLLARDAVRTGGADTPSPSIPIERPQQLTPQPGSSMHSVTISMIY